MGELSYTWWYLGGHTQLYLGIYAMLGIQPGPPSCKVCIQPFELSLALGRVRTLVCSYPVTKWDISVSSLLMEEVELESNKP